MADKEINKNKRNNIIYQAKMDSLKYLEGILKYDPDWDETDLEQTSLADLKSKAGIIGYDPDKYGERVLGHIAALKDRMEQSCGRNAEDEAERTEKTDNVISLDDKKRDREKDDNRSSQPLKNQHASVLPSILRAAAMILFCFATVFTLFLCFRTDKPGSVNIKIADTEEIKQSPEKKQLSAAIDRSTSANSNIDESREILKGYIAESKEPLNGADDQSVVYIDLSDPSKSNIVEFKENPNKYIVETREPLNEAGLLHFSIQLTDPDIIYGDDYHLAGSDFNQYDHINDPEQLVLLSRYLAIITRSLIDRAMAQDVMATPISARTDLSYYPDIYDPDRTSVYPSDSVKRFRIFNNLRSDEARSLALTIDLNNMRISIYKHGSTYDHDRLGDFLQDLRDRRRVIDHLRSNVTTLSLAANDVTRTGDYLSERKNRLNGPESGWYKLKTGLDALRYSPPEY